MGWPALPASLDGLSDSWDDSILELVDCQAQIDNGWDAWYVPDESDCLNHLLIGLQDLHNCVEYMLAYIWPYSPKTKLMAVLYQMRNEYTAGAAEVTMQTILAAMFTSSNEELKQFIALIDAYRQSLWNKPFDVEYWGTVARGFEQWEY